MYTLWSCSLIQASSSCYLQSPILSYLNTPWTLNLETAHRNWTVIAGLVYARLATSSSYRNVYVSYDHPAFWTVFHRYRNNEIGCWLFAAQDLLFLQDASLSMASLHLLLHSCPDSWYHSSFIFNSFRSLHTRSLHLFLGPWHALSLLPQLCSNNTFFGNLSSPILPKWPNHHHQIH